MYIRSYHKKSSKTKAIFYLALSAISVLSLFFSTLISCSGSSRDKRSYEVKRDKLDIFVEAECSTSSRKELKLAFEVSGRLIDIVEEGTEVRKGDVIARLDPGDFENQLSAIEQQIKIKEKEKELAGIDRKNALERNHVIVQLKELQERYNIEKAEGAFKSWQDALDYEEEVKSGTQETPDIIIDELARIEAAGNTARAETNYRLSEIHRGISYWQLLEQELLARNLIAQANRSMELIEENIALLEHKLKDISDNMKKTEIRSPAEGSVVKNMADVGEIAAPAAPIVILRDLKDIEIVAQVDEEDIGKIAEGQDVDIDLDAYPEKEFSGKVSRISSNFIDIMGVRYFNVYIEVIKSDEEKPLHMLPGLSGDIKILADSITDKIVIPNDYIKVRGEKDYVFVRGDQGQITETEIKTGKGNINFSIVEEGLSEGDEIIYPGDMEG